MSWLKKLFGTEQSAPASPVPPAPPATALAVPATEPLGAGERVLVVESGVTIQKVLALMLEDQGCGLTAATNGEEALASLSTTQPTVVLVAAGLPGEGCHKVLDAVKSRPELEGTIVIVLTGAFEPPDETLLSRVAPEDVITKPFEPAQLMDRIRSLRQRRPLGRP